MIEYTIMDYDGEPVIIKDGDMWEPEPPYDYDRNKWAEWNSETCDWEFEPDDEDGESLWELETRCYYWDKL